MVSAEVPGGALAGERCSRHQPRPPTGLMPEHLQYCKGKQTSTSVLLSSHFPSSCSCHGWLFLPQRQLDKAVGKRSPEGPLQTAVDQDIHVVTTNIINLLIVPLPPDNKLLPLASLTHPWLGHSSYLCPHQNSRFQSSCLFT